LAAGRREVTEPESITDPAAAEPAPAATATSEPRATSEPTASSASDEPAVTAASKPGVAAATASASQLHAALAYVLPIEEMKSGETHVGHFLFAKNEALIGHAIVPLWDTRHRGCRCAAD
jgi:uncharacterized protein involved in copper resistance